MMGKFAVPRIEQETTLNFNQAEDTCSIYTAAPSVWRKLERKGFTAYKTDTVAGEVVAKWFLILKSFVVIRNSTKKTLTPEQIASRRLNASKMGKSRAFALRQSVFPPSSNPPDQEHGTAERSPQPSSSSEATPCPQKQAILHTPHSIDL
jgi:hypothetical protein